MITPWKTQIDKAEQSFSVLSKHGLVYLAMEERTGKSLTALLVAEKCPTVTTVLIVTKKGKPCDGWLALLKDYEQGLTKEYTVTTYHQVFKQQASYDLVILDESHNYISSYPKIPGGIKSSREKPGIWQACKRVTTNKPIIYISATPHAQGLQMLYHQFALSSWSPWKTYKSYYAWWNHYGIPNLQWISGRQIEKYNLVKTEEVEACVTHLFITGTRAEIGFTFEPKDRLHYIKLHQDTKDIYNELLKHKIVELPDMPKLICDTPMKLRTSLHQLEGGAAKIEESFYILPNREKINYILATWGDSKDIAIFYHYIAEGQKLRKHFTNAAILQGTSHAEGVDLSMYKTLIVYSQDFSTAKHTQRRARQANKYRTGEIIVHFLLVEGAVSEQVYETVSVNKENFVDSRFERVEL